MKVASQISKFFELTGILGMSKGDLGWIWELGKITAGVVSKITKPHSSK